LKKIISQYVSSYESYYEKGERNPILSPSEFKSTAPIVVVDASKQNDESTASTVDVSIEIDASENLTGVTAYCILIYDRIVEYVKKTCIEFLCSLRVYYIKCICIFYI
jgi:hypothetical protein